jgi:hypothetical protein
MAASRSFIPSNGPIDSSFLEVLKRFDQLGSIDFMPQDSHGKMIE